MVSFKTNRRIRKPIIRESIIYRYAASVIRFRDDCARENACKRIDWLDRNEYSTPSRRLHFTVGEGKKNNNNYYYCRSRRRYIVTLQDTIITLSVPRLNRRVNRVPNQRSTYIFFSHTRRAYYYNSITTLL